jgi:heptosyltransferase II
MVSYAQNAEDVVLRRAFSGVPTGFYVDVGASSPVDDSVTLHFYERGWRGVNVEPDPDDFRALVAARPRDVNLHAAVGPARYAATAA